MQNAFHPETTGAGSSDCGCVRKTTHQIFRFFWLGVSVFFLHVWSSVGLSDGSVKNDHAKDLLSVSDIDNYEKTNRSFGFSGAICPEECL